MEAQKTGILLVNLGTPDSPSTSDVRKYLIEFLTDERVIDIPYIQRQLLVRGIIGPFRAPKSAKSYKEIWTDAGSPLMIYGIQLQKLIAEALGDAYQVEFAMRYQNPSIASQLEKFKGKFLKKIRIVPLFPHYASASTGSVHEEVMRIISKWQAIPEIEFVNSFPTNAGMIKAFAELGRAKQPENFDHILFSFHGLPERQLVKADTHNHCLKAENCCLNWNEKNQYCYSAQCYATAQALAKELGITEADYTVSFQSRLGKTPWKKPYTIDLIQSMPKMGKKKVLVFCPAFVADCLETIFEIGVEYKEEFIEAGGEDLVLVEGLNANPLWVKALAGICKGEN